MKNNTYEIYTNYLFREDPEGEKFTFHLITMRANGIEYGLTK